MYRTWSLVAFVAVGLMTTAASANPAPRSAFDLLQISAPRNGAVVDGPNVVVSGYGNNGTATVQVFRNGSRVYNVTATVRSGRWRTSALKLGNGSYSATVNQGKATSSVSFTVGASKGFGFQSPDNGQVFSGPNVTFSGTADSGNVALRVYRGSSLVFKQDVSAKNGRWSETRRMADGSYRAEASRNGIKRTVSFRVGAGGSNVPVPNNGNSGLDFDVQYPRDGSTVNGPSVTFYGVSTANTISARLYDGNEAVYQGAVEVRNGRWSFTRRMSTGSHSIVVQQGEIIRKSQFNVRFGGSNNNTKPSDKVAITSPPSGRTVVGPRVTFVGTATTTSVGVSIYRGSERIYQSSQKVGRGRWSFTTSLKSGNYRIEVSAGNSRAETGFKVK